jgi:hypothetical protein
LTIRGEEGYVQNSVDTLEHFCLASGLLINWTKSVVYWKHGNTLRPPWTTRYEWIWARPQEMSKFLGSPFGFNLASQSIDAFLIERTKQKLNPWYASKLHLARRIIIANCVILASILFFVIVWTGTTQALKHIRIIVSYFIWAGRETRALARVAWSTTVLFFCFTVECASCYMQKILSLNWLFSFYP